MRFFLSCFLALFLLACNDSSTVGTLPPDMDGGFDQDSSVVDNDAGVDLDASTVVDADVDSSVLNDAGSDASVVTDAGNPVDASVPSAVCGNNVLETGEACDQGTNPNHNCSYGQTSCQVCNASCQLVAGVVVGIS